MARKQRTEAPPTKKDDDLFEEEPKPEVRMFTLCKAVKSQREHIPAMVRGGKPPYKIPEDHPDEVPWELVQKHATILQTMYGRTVEQLADRTKVGLTVEGLALAIAGKPVPHKKIERSITERAAINTVKEAMSESA